MITVDIDLIGVPAFVLEAERETGTLRFAGVNRAFVREIGVAAERLVGRTPRDCLPVDFVDAVEPCYLRCIETGLLQEYDEELTMPDGRRWWRTALTPELHAETGEVVRILGVAVEITERKRLERQLEGAAYRDHLTGVGNRRRLEIDVDDAMAEAAYSHRLFSLVVVDLDDFKSINDAHGHSVGDGVLKQVASLLSLSAKKTETVARIGGDEFALKISATTEVELAAITTSLRRFLDRTISVSGVGLSVGMSVGAALWQPGQSFEDLLAVADFDMYREKARRRAA